MRVSIMTDSEDAFRRKLSRRVVRRLTGMVPVAPMMRIETGFQLSIAFDDCPDSACTQGVEILDKYALKGTFYIATSLLGQDGISGPITTPTRLRDIARAGHEIALHTHSHADLSTLSVSNALSDIEFNLNALQDILGADPSRHFAYPYGETSLSLKRALLEHVVTARGVRGGVNRAFADRMQLFACDLGSHRPNFLSTAQRMMQHAARTGGWLVLFTHDVQTTPSPFGITPQGLESLVQDAISLGATPRPVGEIWSHLLRD